MRAAVAEIAIVDLSVLALAISAGPHLAVKVRNGKMSATDGAFCRSQGALGGFILIDAAVIQACSSGCDPDDDSHGDHYRC